MNDKHIPYFNFYPSDFMGGTRGLSAQQVGVYMMLLCKIYEDNGPVEFDSYKLSTYCGMRENAFVKTFDQLVRLDKLQRVDGKVFNKRAQTEISSRANTLKNNSKAGKASAKKRQQKQRENPTGVERSLNHTDTDTDTDTVDTNVSIYSDQQDLITPEPAKPKASRKKPRTPLPEDWELPNDQDDPKGWIAKAVSNGVPVDEIQQAANKFRDHHHKHDNRMANWKAAWGTWTANHNDYKPKGNANGSGSYNQKSNNSGGPSSTQTHLAAIFGEDAEYDRSGLQEPIDITPTNVRSIGCAKQG